MIVLMNAKLKGLTIPVRIVLLIITQSKWPIMKLLVRNLAIATTEEKLESLFSQYGPIQSCKLVLDQTTGKSKGFGFIEIPKAGHAKAAIKNLNGYKLAGNIIRVKKAEDKKDEAPEVEVKEKAINTPKTREPDAFKKNANNESNIYGKIKQEDY